MKVEVEESGEGIKITISNAPAKSFFGIFTRRKLEGKELEKLFGALKYGNVITSIGDKSAGKEYEIFFTTAS